MYLRQELLVSPYPVQGEKKALSPQLFPPGPSLFVLHFLITIIIIIIILTGHIYEQQCAKICIDYIIIKSGQAVPKLYTVKN